MTQFRYSVIQYFNRIKVFETIKHGIKEIINGKVDSVIYYAFGTQNYYEREIFGIKKNDLDSFI
jgi:CRISPR/Cas system-associated endoribonuclease Cas2